MEVWESSGGNSERVNEPSVLRIKPRRRGSVPPFGGNDDVRSAMVGAAVCNGASSYTETLNNSLVEGGGDGLR